MFGVLMKWDARTIPTIASFIGWFVILLISAFSSRTKIQALVDAGVLILKLEQKKVTANIVTLEFGKTPKVIVPDGSFPIPKARLEVRDPSVKTQEIKGLVPLTFETEEIMWIHPDLVQDEQWASKKSKSKGKSCNVISILPDDGSLTSASHRILKEKARLHNTSRCTSADRYSIRKIILKIV